ncbi:MAG: hypothetical protein PUD92_07730 [Clostridiales bacterium]|nr:hypothetical protein [Clostridiales bacterium]
MMKRLKQTIISLACAAGMLVSGAGNLLSAKAEDTLYVLSGNSFTQADETLYSQYSITLNSADTGASYKWSSDTDEELRRNDGYDLKNRTGDSPYYGQEMIGGDIQNKTAAAAQNQTNSQLESASWQTACFDLNGVYSVSAVDVWSMCGSNNKWKIGRVEIWAGETRSAMKKVCAVTADNNVANASEIETATSYVAERTTAEFTAVNARYIDVRIRKADKCIWGSEEYTVNQVCPAEIVIFGTLPSNDPRSIKVEKAKANAEKYLDMGSYYTSTSIENLRAAVKALKDVNYSTADDTSVNNLITATDTAISGLVRNRSRYTLSGNNWTEEAQTRYYDKWDSSVKVYDTDTKKPVKADNSPSYKWTASSDTPLITEDINNHMNDGNVETEASTNWDGSSRGGIAVFDLGSEYVADRVDIIHDKRFNNDTQKMGYMAVYVSDDGVSYSRIAGKMAEGKTIVIDNSDKTKHLQLETVSFAPHAARYIAVGVNRGSNQVVPAEIAVFGYEKEGILSGNLSTELDRSLYPGLENSPIGLGYEIETNDTTYGTATYKEGVMTNDSTGEELIFGDLARASSENVVHGRWDGDETVTVKVDAGREISLTGVDFYEMAVGGMAGVSSVKLSYSTDNVNYKTLKNFQSDGIQAVNDPLTGNGIVDYWGNWQYDLMRCSYDIGSDAAIRCRYLKFESTKAFHQQILAEVVIRGRIEYPLQFGTTTYTYEGTEGTDGTIAGATGITARGTLINDKNQPYTADVVTAVYDSNTRLIALTQNTGINVPAKAGGTDGTANWSNTISGLNALPEGAYVKNFVWQKYNGDTDDSLIPLAETQKMP